jgi:UDP-glucose 4-epimerase
MKILVTGGAGFIGSHIVDLFIRQGHDVVILDNLSTGKKENINPRAKFYQADIRDKEKVNQIFASEICDAVAHQAAHASVRESVENPLYDADVNILGSLNVLQACVKYKIKKIAFASTGGALYGDAKILPTPEDYPAKPCSPYGVSKLSVENFLYYYKKIQNLNYVILRYANVFGPRQDPFGEAGVVAIFSQKIISNDQPIINGDGTQTRDFVYVEDVARANLLALESKIDEDFFNIGTGRETSINDLFKLMAEISGRKIKEVHGPAKAGEQQTSALDFSKIKKKLGWKPRVDLKEGLEKTLDWFKSKSK